ncbi:MAG: hypothetical protein ACRD0P_10075, partial [Stackebrandtia sp.]
APDNDSDMEEHGEMLDANVPDAPVDTASDDGEVKVVEQGFSKLTESTYSVAFVLKNTSKTDAAAPHVNVDFVDEGGDIVADEESGPSFSDDLIPPGAKLGIGARTYVEQSDVADLEIEVDGSAWYPDREDLGLIRVSDVAIKGGNAMTVKISSTYDSALFRPMYYALFRDGGGKLIGGDSPRADEDYRAAVPPGTATRSLLLNEHPPKGSDLKAVKVFVPLDHFAGLS